MLLGVNIIFGKITELTTELIQQLIYFVFISRKDDSFGGDTNNDGGATSPAIGDWANIKFASGSEGVFDNVFIYYGTGAPPISIEAGAEVELKNIDYEPQGLTNSISMI